MNPLTPDVIKKFVELAKERLKGEWIIIGGALLPLLNISNRATIDIDLIGPQKDQTSEQLAMLKLAEELKIPLESINQAAAFFLLRISGWKEMLVELARGDNMVLFRPNSTLFILLKVSRLSEIDFEDCLKFLEFAKKHNESIDKKKIDASIKKRLLDDVTADSKERLEELRSKIRKF